MNMRQRTIVLVCMLLITAIAGLAGCGGGGGSGAVQSATRTAVLKINLTGTLPAATTYSAAQFTLTLPAYATPASLVPPSNAGASVTASGGFAGGLAAANYTAAVNNTMTVAIITVANVTQPGEIATVSLTIANGAVPTSADFPVSDVQVFSTTGAAIPGMNVQVASVTLQ